MQAKQNNVIGSCPIPHSNYICQLVLKVALPKCLVEYTSIYPVLQEQYRGIVIADVLQDGREV
jgi:hypothetical protein